MCWFDSFVGLLMFQYFDLTEKNRPVERFVSGSRNFFIRMLYGSESQL